MPGRPRRRSSSVTISTMAILKVVLILFGIWLLWFLRDIFAILVAALLLAALIEPFAEQLHKRHIPRGVGVLIVYLILGLIATLVLLLFVPVIITESKELLANFSVTYSAFIESFANLKTLSAEFGLEENFRTTIESVQSGLNTSLTSLFSTVAGVLGALAALFIVLVLAFYMVVEEDIAKKYFRDFAPVEYQPFISKLALKMRDKLGAWLRGQLLLGVIVGLTSYIGLIFIGVDYALLLAIFAGLFEVIPYVGPLISVIPAAFIGFTHSPLQGFLVLGLYLIIQQAENNLLVPKIMQKATGLNPIVTILALLIGVKIGSIDGVIGGVTGALLAIPVAIIVAVIIEELFPSRV